MDTAILETIRELSVDERIQLVEDIWDSIALAPESLELTEPQRRELDRRLALHAENPNRGSTWAEVRSRLKR